MPKCPKCYTVLKKGQPCWQCALNAPADEEDAPPAAQLPAGWNSVKYSIKESPGIRAGFVADLGIADKGHKQHGSNFSGSQTKKAILDNLLAPCRNWSADKWEEMRGKCIRLYGYDPDG